ncbi:MAG: PAS domain S-box protein [Chloroflexota bacterium]
MTDNDAAKNQEIARLKSQVTALEQLLEVYEQTTLEQSDRLEQALQALTKRATELETVARVSAAASTILDTNRLLQEVVDLTKSSFNLYHAHIYLYDEIESTLNLAAGAGEVGRQMVAEGWSIPVGREQSLVARAARSGEGVIVNDVRQDPGWLPNPLLPETRSEMAIPLILGDSVLGVLDLQSAKINEFTQEDVYIHTTLAAQVAVALHNAGQYEMAQKALVEVQQSQALLQTIINATPDWIFIKDQEHRYRMVNRGYAHDLHLSAEDFIGKNDLELGFPEELVKGNPEKGIRGFWADDRLVMEGGETQVYPDDPATINGEVHTFHTIKTPLRDARGEIWGVLAFARDITDHKQIEEELRSSQEQLSEALDIAKLAHWEFDVESQTFTFNDQFYSLFRTTAEQEGGHLMPAMQYAQKFVHPDDAYLVGLEIKQALETSDPNYSRQLEHRIIRADGSEGYIQVRFRVVKDEQGRTVKTVGANQDITERKQMEQALQQSEIRYRTLAENVPIGIYRNTPGAQGKFLMANPALRRTFGYDSLEQFLQIDVADLYSDPARRKAFSDKLLAQGRVIAEELEMKRKDGTSVWVAVTATAVRNEAGEIEYFDGIIEDITERKRIEETLRENEARLSEATSIAQLGYWELDLQTQMFTFTDQLYALLRTTAAQEGGYQMPIMQYAQKFVHPDDAYMVGVETQNAIETTDPNYSTQIEHRIIRADGSEGYIIVRFRVIKDEQGRTIKTIGANQDITERKQAELERERLLAEAEAAYRRYVRREWAQFLGEQHRGQWCIEYQQPHLAAELSSNGNPRATIATPISLRGQSIGRLSLEDLDPDRAWTAEEKALLETVSEQLALTIENLRLFEDTRQQATREQLTRQITDKMRSAPDAESIIKTGLNELAKVLGVPRTYVKLTSPQEPAESPSKIPEIEAIRTKLKHNGLGRVASSGSAQNEGPHSSDRVEEN